MKLLKFLHGFFSNSNANINANDLKDKNEDYKSLDIEKINLLLKKHNCNDQEELVIKLQEMNFNYDDFTEDEKIFFDNPEWDLLKDFACFGFSIDREQRYLKSAAIQQLIERRYHIHVDEYDNPFKELLNYSLKYFKRYFAENPSQADILIKESFPLMYPYIKRQLFIEQKEIIHEVQMDEQNAFDEFLFFCKNTLCKLYPDKRDRDEQIRHHFKNFHQSLIQFIDDEEEIGF